MTEAAMLHERGTKAFKLPASAIVSTARRDLQHRRENMGQQNGFRHRYAFLALHVRQAQGSVVELLTLAIERNGEAELTTKLATRRLYDDRAGLAAALAEVQAAELAGAAG